LLVAAGRPFGPAPDIYEGESPVIRKLAELLDGDAKLPSGFGGRQEGAEIVPDIHRAHHNNLR